jgi:glycosyltransferase involved in cell wall biosynthesis
MVNLGRNVSEYPTKNEAKNLPFLLNILIFQTYSNIEILVADCISTDNIEYIARELGEGYLNCLILCRVLCAVPVEEPSVLRIVRSDSGTTFPTKTG